MDEGVRRRHYRRLLLLGVSIPTVTVASHGQTASANYTVGTDVTKPITGNVVSNGRTWKPSMVEDFTRSTTPANFVSTYTNLGHITQGKYRNDLTCTVSNGVLNIATRHAGSYDIGAWIAFLPNGNSKGSWSYTGNARFSFRVRSTANGSGYGTAVLLSVADNNNWTRDGEMDVWEGDNGTSTHIFQHLPGAPTTALQTALPSTLDYHIMTVEWIGGVSTTYYLDGVKVASYGPSQTASSTAQFMAILQTASSDNSDNGAPDTSTSNVYLDWVTVHTLA